MMMGGGGKGSGEGSLALSVLSMTRMRSCARSGEGLRSLSRSTIFILLNSRSGEGLLSTNLALTFCTGLGLLLSRSTILVRTRSMGGRLGDLSLSTILVLTLSMGGGLGDLSTNLVLTLDTSLTGDGLRSTNLLLLTVRVGLGALSAGLVKVSVSRSLNTSGPWSGLL